MATAIPTATIQNTNIVFSSHGTGFLHRPIDVPLDHCSPFPLEHPVPELADQAPAVTTAETAHRVRLFIVFIGFPP